MDGQTLIVEKPCMIKLSVIVSHKCNKLNKKFLLMIIFDLKSMQILFMEREMADKTNLAPR